MNEALDPAIVALAGGSTMLGAIYFSEQRREAAMRRDRQRYDLRFPIGATESQAAAALSVLTGGESGSEFVLELQATANAISHHLHIPAAATALGHQIEAAIPGLAVAPAEPDSTGKDLSTGVLRVHIPASALLRIDDAESANRGLLNSLARLLSGEEVRLYVALRPSDARLPEGEPQSPAARDHHRRLRRRASEPTFAAGVLAVTRAASRPRSRALLDAVAQHLRSRLAEGPRLRCVYDGSARRLGSPVRSSRRSATPTVREIVGITGWPLGEEAIPRVSLGAARTLLVPDSVGRTGVQLLVGRDLAGPRPVSLSQAAQRLHTLALGPTGSGKSTLIARVVLDAIAAGQAGILLDPKDGALVEAIVNRVPDAHRDRIVVLDPADRRAPIGVDLFAAGDPYTRAEAITATLRAIYAPMGAFGVRAETYLALAIRSLAVLPNPSLLLVGRLFTDARLRQYVVSRLGDPVLQMAWAVYDQLGPEAQREHVAAPLNRLMGLLQRPPVMATLAQPQPLLNLGQLWNVRGWLLVDLAPSAMGEGASRLLASILGFLAWSTLEARAGRPEEEQVPTDLVFDELQALSELPVSIERLAERARSFGGQLLLATQAASRLPKPLADAIFGNFATVITFKSAGHAESVRVSAELPGLTARDLMALPAYGVAARVATGAGTGVVTVTGRTEPLPARTGNSRYIRSRSAERFGTPRQELERSIREQLGGDLRPAGERPAPGRTRRAS